jgi:hypothetical protein
LIRLFFWPAAAALLLAGFSPLAGGDDVSTLVARIKTVGREGAGNVEAGEASQKLATLETGAILEILKAADDADPAALNWLRAGVDAIAERALQQRRALPAAELEAFVLDRGHAGPVRRLAYEWLAKVDSTAPDRLIPRMLDDPSVELRRDAVEREITASQKVLDSGDKPGALAAFLKLFTASRDPDQVDLIAKRLESLGEKVDLTRHFGCVQEWRLTGPFDNTEKRGFSAVFPPETELKLDAEYSGKVGKVRWIEHRSADVYGVVDLNKALGKHMGVTAYAVAWVESPDARSVHIRAGSPNAIKIWLNGENVFLREEYHHGASMDQYQVAATLRPGRNTVLIKVCQNEEKEEWTQDWNFQLRVCDPTGGGLR